MPWLAWPSGSVARCTAIPRSNRPSESAWKNGEGEVVRKTQSCRVFFRGTAEPALSGHVFRRRQKRAKTLLLGKTQGDGRARLVVARVVVRARQEDVRGAELRRRRLLPGPDLHRAPDVLDGGARLLLGQRERAPAVVEALGDRGASRAEQAPAKRQRLRDQRQAQDLRSTVDITLNK